METIFMNTENSKTNVPHKFVLNLPQRSDLRSSNKYLALQYYLSLCYTRKNIRKPYKNNKLKTIARTWIDEFELPDRSDSVSDMQDYIEYIIKKHNTSTTILSIHIYINTINKRLVDISWIKMDIS